MTSSRKFKLHLSILFWSALFLLVGCGAPAQDAPSLPDAAILERAPIQLTSEARAEATNAASGTRVGGFQGRTNVGSASGETPAPDDALPATEEVTKDATGEVVQEAEQTPTADAIVEAQLTKAPTVAAFLTMVATTTAAESTPTPPPPSGCPGGCITYPSWCEPPIKGSISIESGESGERVYTMPDDDSYDDTPIDPSKGDRYFCTSEEAEAAGFQAK